MDKVFAFKTEWKPGNEVRVFISAQKENVENFNPGFTEEKTFEITEEVQEWDKEDFEEVDGNFKATRRTYYYVGKREENVKIVDHVHGSQYIESMICRND